MQTIAHDFAQREFESAPPDDFDWSRLFQLQMGYLLLWTAIERYCALSYGPNLDPMEKVRMLGHDPTFIRALTRVSRNERVFDSRDPGDRAILDPQQPSSSAKYYYLVRNNLSHRGKGAWKDGEIIRQSLLELLDIFQIVLQDRLLHSDV